ncbi:hypothetical protein CQ020_09025 [Arthrobacter sp. MYb23]|uniref:hypothetical protein n=1 Tax=unclassified Arthrobacter TaxID=235627 RepID=UPI000CFC31C3|nr:MULTISPECIES: hypothetical protein [unclassified Arthrobacter]PRB42721.1 hypothetical protein CQ038_09800 [Arthrobacter sp. MYb51]PRB96603.1 hypothetical protein CQ020_09025 [Arthrobacter sp. MYb23]
MTMEPVRSKRRPVLIALAIAVVLAVVASVVVIALTNFAGQQRRESLTLLKDERLNALVEARDKIQPAANAYLAAYKKARNVPATREEAEKNSAKERDDFQQAINSARSALSAVQTGNGSSEEAEGIGVAAAQLGDSYQAYLDSMEGLVESYAQFEGLFREDGAGCNGLFVGSKAANLRERQTLLGQAAVPCREAVNQLKQSKNISYVEFARTLDNEIAQLESHAETTAKSEENYNEFVRLKDEYVKKADDATARNASEEELLKIADEVKAFNTRIKNNRSEFDFAAKRYLNGVKEMPTLVEEVFSKNVAAQIKHHDTVIPLRVQVLKDAIDAELAA